MIVYGGIKKNNNVAFLIFVTTDGVKVEIPIEVAVADRISKYLSKIAPAPAAVMERGNDEDSD